MPSYILTGTAGAGKTAILRLLETSGYPVVEEAATDVIALGLALGRADPWCDDGFIDRIVTLQRQRQDSVRAARDALDRSPACTLALSRYSGLPESRRLADEVSRMLAQGTYAPEVFFIRNQGFAEPTAARQISFEDSLFFEQLHEQLYRELGFRLVDVPAGPLAGRVKLILKAIGQPGKLLAYSCNPMHTSSVEGGSMGIRVAVAGASGYAGGELLRLLAGHPDLEITAVSAGSSAGKPVTSIHPNLVGHPAFDGKNFQPTTADKLGDAELIFMALPHGQSAALAEQLPDARIVDLSADFRLGDEDAWHQFYGQDVRYAGRWAYGLPELPSPDNSPGNSTKDKIKAARTVAAPGCYATTTILALAPLLGEGLVEPADIVVVAASGTSGAGRSPRVDLLASEVMGSMSAYKVGGTHRHTPEIEQALSEASGNKGVTLSFTPTLAPMPRGILATSTAVLTEKAKEDLSTLRKAFQTAYGTSPFVHLLPEGQWPATASVYGSNGAHVQVAADLHVGRAVVISTTDNLGKGAAGQAVQLANLMLGLPETAGLTTHGVAP